MTWTQALWAATMLITVYGRAVLHGDHLVHTKLGVIRGIEQKYGDQRVSAFLGVPYARPPVGTRRFAIPEMIEKWTGEMEANFAAKTCYLTIDTAFPQFPGAEMWNPPNGISEDCLNMNIWVPEVHDGSVLVWIYGGGFFSGSPSLALYDGTVLAAKKRTIVVNINYRLGPFGFLYLGDDSLIPGNMGLLDQQVALQWVHDNIESAGSASATAHLAAPDSHNYFNKIIANSGTIINSWASRTPDTMLELSLRLAKRLNCTSHGTDPLLIHNCLKAIPASTIQSEADIVSGDIGLPMTFAFVPVSADRNFFKGDVFDRLRRRDFKKDVSAILGSVKDEGTYWLPYYMNSNRYGFWFNHTISAEDPQNRALITRWTT
uniref:Acetylcholinesterase n=1 Tax=Heterorhabditis bacteriophora TaxID=37862 RepID=A0A1I7XNU0_HETBA